MGGSAGSCEDGEDLGLAAQLLLVGVPETSANVGGRHEGQPGTASSGHPYCLTASTPDFVEPAALGEISLQPDEL